MTNAEYAPIMIDYLVAIYRPNGYDPSTEDDAMTQGIDAVNEEMVAEGARVFVGGLRPPGEAKAIRRSADGSLSIESGLYLDAGEHVGGLWVLRVADENEAIAWARKAANACRASVEIRPFYGEK